MFDTEIEEIDHIYYNDNKQRQVYTISFKDREKRVWGSSADGVRLFNPITRQFECLNYPKVSEELYYNARNIIEDKANHCIYLGVDEGEGLYQLDLKKRQWQIIHPKGDLLDNDPAFKVMDILEMDKDYFLVLGTNDLLLFNKNTQVFKPLNINWQIEGPYFRRMVKDQQGNIWIGSRRHGLFQVNWADKTVINFKEELEVDGSTTRFHWIEGLMVDSEGDLWIRTGSGFSIYDQSKKQFLHFPYEDGKKKNSFLDVNNFVEDTYGNVWITGAEEGLGRASLFQKEKRDN